MKTLPPPSLHYSCRRRFRRTRPFGEYGNQVIALAPEISTVGWLPEIKPERAEDAIRTLAQSGVAQPRFVGPDGAAVDPAKLDRPLYPIVDIAPEKNRRVLGVDAGAFPERLAAIRQARDTRKVARTSPLRLVQAPADDALLLYGPVFAKDGTFLGVIGFGYKVEPLFQTALANPKRNRNFSIRVNTAERGRAALCHGRRRRRGIGLAGPDTGTTDINRSLEFGGRPLTFTYASPRDLPNEAFRRGVMDFPRRPRADRRGGVVPGADRQPRRPRSHAKSARAAPRKSG